MSSATITIPEDLELELDEVARERNITQAEVIEAALRKYLTDLQQDRRSHEPDEFVPFWMPVLPEKDDHGEPDVSINHDHYLAEDSYRRKLGRS